MKTLMCFAVTLAAVPASAQMTASGASMNSPNYSTYAPGTIDRLPLETPTMRAEKLNRAVALRAEVDALLTQDGGKLSPRHEDYVRRKACEILGLKHVRTGSLTAQRRCD